MRGLYHAFGGAEGPARADVCVQVRRDDGGLRRRDRQPDAPASCSRCCAATLGVRASANWSVPSSVTSPSKAPGLAAAATVRPRAGPAGQPARAGNRCCQPHFGGPHPGPSDGRARLSQGHPMRIAERGQTKCAGTGMADGLHWTWWRRRYHGMTSDRRTQVLNRGALSTIRPITSSAAPPILTP